MNDLIEFLRRPQGGMEWEASYAVAEIWYGMTLIISPFSVWNSQALQNLYGWFPTWLLGIPFVTAGILTTVGFILFYFNDHRSSIVRFLSGSISMIIWGWIALTSYLIIDGSLPALGLYVMGAVMGFRVMLGSWMMNKQSVRDEIAG